MNMNRHLTEKHSDKVQRYEGHHFYKYSKRKDAMTRHVVLKHQGEDLSLICRKDRRLP
jgi:Co/Zn/Cd efflux system component